MRKNFRRTGGRRGGGGDLFSQPIIKGEKAEVLEGVLERVTFASEETGWSVIRLLLPDRRDPVAAVGYLPGVQPGENLRLHGRWVHDRRYGEQFQVESYVTVAPSTLPGIERYLGSGLIRGVGKVMAARLVERFGLDTLDILDRHPERLQEVEGIGRRKREQIVEAWAEQRSIREVMLFLQSHGVTTAFAFKIQRRYGDMAIALIKENPYRLAADIPGIGFKTADRIASALGTPPDSPKRASAGVLHTLGEAADEGHLFLPREELESRAASMLQVGEELARDAVAELSRQGSVVLEDDVEGRPVYLARFCEAERRSADRLRGLLAAPSSAPPVVPDRAVEWFEKREGIRLAEPQREAVRRAMTGRVMVVTGGPGTGKTTIVNAIVKILERKGTRILLCAPTGRAAKRMEETTGREAKTIHRLLEYNPGRQLFERGGRFPLEADLVVVDEVSMVDALLFDALLDAVPRGCRMILVGDVDQLPSVGPGNVLRDLIRSGAVDVVVLEEIFRQARESLIIVNAHRINRGEMPHLSAVEGKESDFFMIQQEEPLEILKIIKELIAERIPARYGVDAVDDIQVLTPMHRGELGATNLNAELQALLNPGGEAVSRGSRSFRVGDKVMQIRNNYDLGVFNGDLGRVVSVDHGERQVAVRFEERRVIYDLSDLDELVLGYACSIHKAQGSEYPVVVMPLHTQHYALLQRNLVYTGITRGRRLVVVVGTARAVAIAVKNNRVRHRYTRLAERLAREDLRYCEDCPPS